jgi:hypothetical protein
MMPSKRRASLGGRAGGFTVYAFQGPTHALNAPPGQALRPKGADEREKRREGIHDAKRRHGRLRRGQWASRRGSAGVCHHDRRAWLGGWHHWQFAMCTHHFQSRRTAGIGVCSSDGQHGAGRDWKARALLARPEAAESGEVFTGEMRLAVDPNLASGVPSQVPAACDWRRRYKHRRSCGAAPPNAVSGG